MPDLEALTAAGYVQTRGFPTTEMAQAAYDDADFNRAIQAYRFFFPTVSGLAIFKGNEAVGLVSNRVFGYQATEIHDLHRAAAARARRPAQHPRIRERHPHGRHTERQPVSARRR
jgi:hypothetical protein